MKKFFLLVALAFSASPAFSQQATFTSSGTWTVPAGVTSVTVEVVGAGGNGRGNGRGGGGGGGYASGTFTVVPNATHTITVGTGGSTTATSVSGLGIQATPGATAPNASTSATPGGAGGVGSGGTVNYTGGAGGAGTYTYFGGGGGGAAGATGNGGAGGATPAWSGNCLTPGGAGGTSGGGPGGAGGKGAGFIDNACNVANPAAPGASYGGGGGGGNGNSSPFANGADGFVSITWCSATAAPTGAAAQSFCDGSGATVADLVAVGTGIQWYTTATGGTALVSTTPLASGPYYASQTISGCESTTRLAVTVTIDTTAAPTGAATQTFCSYNTPTVADLDASGTAVVWYTAATGGVPLAGSTLLVNGQQYFASQTISGCESATRLPVTANITTLNVVATSTSNNTISVGLTAGATYQWINCANNQAIPAAAGSSYTATANGNYAVIVTLGNCSDTSACVPITTAGVDDVKVKDAVSLYPNPASEAITIKVPRTLVGTSYSITDAAGRKVKEGKLVNETTELAVRDLATGVYHFKATGYAGQAFKVVKQ